MEQGYSGSGMADGAAVQRGATRVKGMLSWGMVAVLGFIWIGIALAWGAVVVRFGRTGWEWAGAGITLAWAATCATVLVHVGRHWSNRMSVGVAAGMVLAVCLGVRVCHARDGKLAA